MAKYAPPFPVELLPEHIQRDVKKYAEMEKCDISAMVVYYMAAHGRVVADRKLSTVVGSERHLLGRIGMFEDLVRMNGGEAYVKKIEAYLRSQESPVSAPKTGGGSTNFGEKVEEYSSTQIAAKCKCSNTIPI
jgi:hypothetical protein